MPGTSSLVRWILGSLTGLALLAVTVQSQAPAPLGEPVSLPAPHPKDVPAKMDGVLAQLWAVYRTQGLTAAQEFANRHGIDDWKDGTVRVVVEVEDASSASPDLQGLSSAVEPVTRRIEALGGTVEAAHDVRIQGRVRVDALEELARHPSVRFVRRPRRPFPLVVSEGVERVGAPRWWNITPYRGQPVRVAVLDLGFRGADRLRGVELPNDLITRAFNPALWNVEPHGTACAEIVYDMNPGLDRMWLVNFGTDVEHSLAVDYLIGQRVNVISYSIGWTNIGAGDGTGPIDEDVKRAVRSGIAWVAAAGNEAQSHWEGPYSDPDGDRWHNFAPDSEILHFYSPGRVFCADLNWDDWGPWNGRNYRGSDQDYDLYVWAWDPWYGWWGPIGWSIGSQTGSEWPTESICLRAWRGWFGISVYRYRASRNVKLELFLWGATDLEHVVPEGSILIPADAREAIAVGATDWSDDALHDYSSRGPTNDGRTKPDLTAPSGVASATYGRFFGTSASTPHVAGAISLVLAKTPYTPDQVRAVLEGRALDLGPRGPDNLYGRGRLRLTP